MNFVAVQCLRQQLDRMLGELRGMSNEELLSRACVRTRDGGMQISAKIFTDLAAAMEACHRMSYAALSDTATERAERDSDRPAGQSSNDLHAAIIASLSDPGVDPGPITQRLITEANDKAREMASVNPQPEQSGNHDDQDESA
jgi:hypothetical protein